MLLDELFQGTLQSQFVLIKDCADQKGHKLQEALLQYHLSKPRAVHYLNFSPRRGTQQGVTWHGVVAADPLGWYSAPSPVNICNFLTSKAQQGDKVVLFIDSLSSALVALSAEELYSQIHQLLNRPETLGLEVVQLVSIIHGDVEDATTLGLFSRLASTVINVQPAPDKQLHPCYSLTHLKPNGKYFTESQLYSIGENGQIQSVAPNSLNVVSASTNQGTASQPIHDGFSTFRHGLSSEEQEARGKLVLPFQQLSLGPRGKGCIEYELEEADGWDEEDPDDDLEV